MPNRNTLIIAFIAVLATVGTLWLTGRGVAPHAATIQDVMAEAHRGGYQLIHAPELAQRLAREAGRLLVVDTRQEWEYRAGHIQGALNLPMEPTWWARWRKQGALADLLGPDKKRPVVFY